MATYIEKPEVFTAVTWTKPTDISDTKLLATTVDHAKTVCTACGKPMSEHGVWSNVARSDILCPGKILLIGDQGHIISVTEEQLGKRFEEVTK